MTSILCLAHYCDTHGPTPLMVTEELPVACSTCFADGANDLPDTPLPSAELSRNPSGSFDRDSDVQIQRLYPAEPSTHSASTVSTINTINTPPESPRIAALQPARAAAANGHRRDSSFRKTYDEADKKRAIPCENCALTLPKKVSALPPGAPKALDANGSPVLRTRKPYELVAASVSPSPKSSPSDSDDPDRYPAAPPSRRRSVLRPAGPSSSSSSLSSSTSTTRHTHYLDYTSAHDPLTTSSFSLLRAACLRTLSCETLPPTTSAAPPFAKSPSAASPVSSSGPTSASASGGPIFFGDPLAGYTTAFIFRIPDPCARGRRRVYAFLCLSATGERKAMRAFGFLAGAFRELAGWIQGLAEAEADAAGGGGAGGAEAESRGVMVTRDRERERMPTSSFLGGRHKGYDGDGVRGGGGMGMGIRGVRSKGLAELVGRPDFFIELHVRFVALLAQLRFLIEGS